MAKFHDGWVKIFDNLNIVSEVNSSGYFDITADQIKAVSTYEPRLMTKIDFREQLPPVMRDNKLALLAIENGTYRIGRFDPFMVVSTESKVTPQSVPFPRNIITLNPQELAHESAALDAALVSGVLTRVFGEEVALTIRGRHSKTPPFNFSLNQVPFPVSGVQIEVDGGYEGETSVNLVEAKIGARGNINIRQLLYPQLVWESTINRRKTVRTYICYYQEPILRFIPVLYENGLCRADHLNEKAFTLEPEARLQLMTIRARTNAPYPVLGVPFPQADRFDTVLAMFSIVGQEEEITKERLALDFDIVPRQIDYYSNAMRWLGLIEASVGGGFHITDLGRDLSSMSHADRMLRLADIIFGEPVFHYALHNKDSSIPANLFSRWNCGTSTITRRSQTVKAWVRYFESYAKRING